MNYFKSNFLLMALMAFLGLQPQQGLAVEKIIYGEDNRYDLVDSPLPLFNDLASSTAALSLIHI